MVKKFGKIKRIRGHKLCVKGKMNCTASPTGHSFHELAKQQVTKQA